MTDDQLTTATDEQATPPMEPAADLPTDQTPEVSLSETQTPESTPEPDVKPETAHEDAQQAEAPAAAPTPEPEPTPVTTPASEPKADAGPQMSDAELFDAAMAELGGEEKVAVEVAGAGHINKGDRIEAKVIQVEKDRVFVDLGTKAEGVIPLAELGYDNASDANDVVKMGDTFEVIVLRTNSAEGSPIVSKKRADFDQMWQKILDNHTGEVTFEAPVVDRVKGGLVVDIGVRGFIPATHVGNGKLRNLEKYVGQSIPVKIIEIDKERKKVVLSNRVAEAEHRESVKDEVFSKVTEGDVLPGTVRRLTDYGAFVDLGGIDGLLHISEISWMRIDHPKEVLKVGEEINVKVLRLDSDGGRISLGLRQVLPDPWNLVREAYKVGQKVKVTVNRMVQSGAFIRMPEGIEAFLPLSEMSDKRIKTPEEALTVGDEIEPTIIDLRPEDRRMVLSLRDNAQFGTGADYRMPFDQRRPGGRPGGGNRGPRRDFEPSTAPQRTPTGGATIGERLGALKGILGRGDAPETEPKAKESKSSEKASEPEVESTESTPETKSEE
ncbi:MAG: 30S ribosomal protein S1 [Fimbriimonadaceae bacterium]|nr:30S ribosomal protein S1 [Fimbriimonadaceae bacterium]